MSKQKDESIYRKGWDDGFAKGAAAARFQLEAENEKLLELVRDMLRRYYRPFIADDADKRLAMRAEELGVEV